jgi:excisionase family DNA binding protein
MTEERLETPRQLAARVGITERQVRHLICNGQLEHVKIGSRVLIPVGAFGRFVEETKVKLCHVETKDRDFAGSSNVNASTSHGPNGAAAASARLARQTANRLKMSSRNGSMSEGVTQAHVIPLRSS